MASLSEKMADYFCRLRYEDIPAAMTQAVKRLILDYLGVAARGCGSMSGRVAIEYVLAQKSQPVATVIGAPREAAPLLAAFANAISSHSLELDDVDDLALYHFSPSVVSAALAAGEKSDASGAEVVKAVYAGCEMMARLSNVMNPSLRNRGFHTTPVCGAFGAAVAAGLLLNLTKDQMISALGLAGAQCGGLMEFYGESLQKRFNTGPPARNGVTAAEMAQLGFTGSRGILEGKRGLFKAFADDADESAFLEGLGQKFPAHIDFKPYASARPIHNGVDCALQIRGRHHLDPKNIKTITIFRHPDWADYHLIYEPKNINEAQVSLPYSVAVAFVEGDAFLEQYEDRLLTDPQVRRITKAVEVKPEATLPRGVSCRMVVETSRQESHQAQVDYAKGSEQNPLSQDELIGKFKRLAGGLLSAAADGVVEKTLSLENVARLKELTSCFRVKA